MGNDRSDKKNTASKFNTSYPNIDLLYKSQPLQTVSITKTTNMRYCKSYLGKTTLFGITVL